MDVARRHPIATYLVVVYALAAVIYLPPLLGQSGLGIIPVDIPVTLFLLVTTIILAGVAFAVTALSGGRDGVRDLRRRLFRFAVNPVWYVLAFFLLPAAALAVAMVTHGTEPLAAIGRNPNLLADWFVINVASSALIINLWEETAWTGFFLHRLQRRFGALIASVLTAWAHAAIHLPLLFIIGGVSDVRIAPEQYPIYGAVLFIAPIGNKIVLTWLYNRSRHSLPVAGITHASFNLAAGPAFLPAVVPGFNELWAYAGYAAVAVVLIVVTRGRLGYDRVEREARPTPAGERLAANGSAQ